MATKRKSKPVVAAALDNFGDVLQGAKAFADESDAKIQKRHEELLRAIHEVVVALQRSPAPFDFEGKIADELKQLRESMMSGPSVEKLADAMMYLGTRVMEYIEHKRSGVF